MFGLIKRWREARDNVAWESWEDLDNRLLMAEVDDRRRLAIALNVEKLMSTIGSQYDLNHMSDAQKKALAGQLRSDSRSVRKSDQDMALAMGVLCLWIECETLPGEQAAVVREAAEVKINELLEIADRYEKHSEEMRLAASEKEISLTSSSSLASQLVFLIEDWRKRLAPLSKEQLGLLLEKELGADRYAIYSSEVILLPPSMPMFKVRMIPPPLDTPRDPTNVEFSVVGDSRYSNFMLVAKGKRADWFASVDDSADGPISRISRNLVHDLSRECGVLDYNALRSR